MNKARRSEISQAVDLIEQARPLLERAMDLISTAQSDEEDYFNDMPENLQGGEKGEASEAAASELQEALDLFPEIDELVEHLNNACE